jgi:hypothetical protein
MMYLVLPENIRSSLRWADKMDHPIIEQRDHQPGSHEYE